MIPFDNEYKLRLVSENDSKSCAVCYKPSSRVLITNNNQDFFYVCPSHLKDSSFSKPIPSQAYNDLESEKSKLETELKELNKSVEAKRPGFTSYFKKSTPNDNEKDNKDSYEELVKRQKSLQQDFNTLTTQINQFQFKMYCLNDDMYKIRIKNYMNKKMNEKRLKNMARPGFFPSVPGKTMGQEKSSGSNNGNGNGNGNDNDNDNNNINHDDNEHDNANE